MRRINQRARQMFESGLIEETKALLEKYGAGCAAAGFSRIQAGGAGPSRQNLPATRRSRAAQQAHRNYAKRQMTWFRREPEVRWLRGFGDDPGIQQEALLAVDSIGCLGQLHLSLNDSP